MSITYDRAEIDIALKTQYHVGSGFGLGRVIDSLLWVDKDGVPLLPGSTVSGVMAQGMFDLLDYEFFNKEKEQLCPFQTKKGREPRLPCGIIRPDDPCLMCYFFGSPAEEGLIEWIDFTCVTDPELLRPMMKSGNFTGDERGQYIKPYFSHRQNMRTRTVLEKHFFCQEEGAGDLEFKATVRFKKPIPEDKAMYLAAALKNVRAVGRRKSRGKGACTVNGTLFGKNGSGLVSKNLIDLVNLLLK